MLFFKFGESVRLAWSGKRSATMNKEASIKLLRQAVWLKAIGKTTIVLSRAYCEKIGKSVGKALPDYEPITWITVRDFLGGDRKTATKTLDKFSNYVLNEDPTTLYTFQHWVDHLEKQGSASQSAGKEIRFFNKRSLASALLIGILLIGCVIFSYEWLKPKTDKRIDFAEMKTIEDLYEKGFELFDPDTNYLRIGNGPLVMYTLPGDYWVKPKESPEIKNFLVHPLQTNGCYEIEVHIPGFAPYQNWQSVSVYLFNTKNDRNDWVRFGIGYNSSNNGELKAEVYHSQNGKVTRSCSPLPIVNNINSNKLGIPADFWLTIKNDNSKLYFYLHRNKSWNARIPVCEFQSPFTNNYFGLCASQGITDPDGCPLDADFIPAYFEYVSIVHCPPPG